MKVKKSKYIIYGVFIAAIIFAIISKFKEQRTRTQLKEIQSKETLVSKHIASKNELLRIDSLLIKGEYVSALDAYLKQLKTTDDPEFIKIRIQLAEQFIKLSGQERIQDSMNIDNSLNSDVTTKTVTSEEIRKFDSLNFALTKVKAQLNRLKKKQQKKSYGEYLTFKNRKRHKIHYVGQVRNDKANGYGVAFFDTGSRYEGEWKENLRHGDGSFYWTDGQSYVGEYQNDRRQGKGTYFWPNGEKYVGEWKDDQRNGEGIFYGKNDKIITKGIWKHDKLVEENKNK